jgi:hypothetical protein
MINWWRRVRRPADPARKLGRGWLPGVFLATFLVYAWATPTVLANTEPPTGDQPFYLQTAISILEDFDIDEHNNYTTAASYDQFYPQRDGNPAYPPGFLGIPAPYPLPPATHVGATVNRPAEEWYSKHGLGVPILILPGWVIGKALTPLFAHLTVNGGGGWPGTVFEFNILGALLAVQVFLLAWDTTHRRGIALAVWAVLAFSNPQMSYSLLIFPEMPAALLAVYAFRRLNLGWAANNRWQLLLVGICIGYIPWLHSRFLPITLVLALFALYRWWRARPAVVPTASASTDATLAPAPAEGVPTLVPAPSAPAPGKRGFLAGDLGRLALVLVPVAIAGLALAGYYQWLYGKPLPNTQDHAGFFQPWLSDVERTGLVFSTLGLFLDQQWGLLIYAPIFALAVVGAFTLWQAPSKRATLGWLALLIVPYFAVVAEYRVWWGEWCPPARYLMVITPLLAAPLAQSLLTLQRSAAYKALYVVLGGIGVSLMGGLMAGLADRPGGQLPAFFNHPSGQAALFQWINSRFQINLLNLIPSFVPWFGGNHTYQVSMPLVVAFLALFSAVIIGGLMLLDTVRQEADDRVAFHNYIEPAPR